jgi:hypothetical protein
MSALDDAIAASQTAAGEAGVVVDRNDVAGTAVLELSAGNAMGEAIDIDSQKGHTFPRPHKVLPMTERKYCSDGAPSIAETDAAVAAYAVEIGETNAATVRILNKMALEALGKWAP